jgi:GT2 family glycosyltransferase
VSLDGTAEPDVVAVVLTHRRPRLATQVVENLVEREGFEPARVLLVVNEFGGLNDPDLEASIGVHRLAENTGPAGGFAAGLAEARSRYHPRWIYLCEDDVGLLTLPTGRVADLIAQVDRLAENGRRVGAVVAYGRDVNDRTGISTPHRIRGADRFEPVDVAAWGAALVSAEVVDAGVLPDPDWFFGYEDHDFWIRVRAAGFEVLVDTAATRATAGQVSGAGRAEHLARHRPTGKEEVWRLYYHSRNLVEFSRRHGRWTWMVWHLAKSVRRVHLNGVRRSTPAVVRGLVDGWRGRLGRNDRFLPTASEH